MSDGGKPCLLMKKKSFLILILVLTSQVACRSMPSAGEPFLRTELYFGLSKPDGGLVSQEEWRAFVNEKVTPRFPDGLTVLEARGQWRLQTGEVVSEDSRILILFHPATEELSMAIEAIREEYKKMFAQEAVMRVGSRARVSF